MIRIFQKNVVSVVYDVTQHVYYCTNFSLLEHSDIKAVIFYINLALPPLVNIKIYYLLHQRMRLRFISTHIYSKNFLTESRCYLQNVFLKVWQHMT